MTWRFLEFLDDVAEIILVALARFAFRRWRLVTAAALILYVCSGLLFAPPPKTWPPVPEGVPPFTTTWKTFDTLTVQTVLDAGKVAPENRAGLARILEDQKEMLDRTVALTSGSDLVRCPTTPSFRRARDLSRLLTARGILEEQDSRTGAAVQDFIAACRLGRGIARGNLAGTGTLIELMIGCAIEREGVKALLRHARSGRMGPTEVRLIRDELRRRPAEVTTLAMALRGEAGFCRTVMEEFGKTNRWPDEGTSWPARLMLPATSAGRQEAASEIGSRIEQRFEELARCAERGGRYPDHLLGPKASPGFFHLVEGVTWLDVMVGVFSRSRGVDVLTRVVAAIITPNVAKAGERLDLREAEVRQLDQLCGR